MLKISYAGCLGLPLAIWAQFTLEMHVAARNKKKITKTPAIFWGFKVIDVDIPKKLVAIIRVCKFGRLHVTRKD